MPEDNFDLNALTTQINNFKQPKSGVQLNVLGLSDDNKKKLFEGCPAGEDPKEARTAFLEHLEKISKANNSPKLPSDGKISIKALLGEDGLALYKKAIEEERNSKAFRTAVLCDATTAYHGPKWTDRLIMWVGGPSASGKTFGTENLIKAESDLMTKKDNNKDEKNYVVAIDGGVERDISQMRHIVLDVALKKTYANNNQKCVGILDLHENTKLDCKKYVEKAVMHQYNLNMVIPATFILELKNLANMFLEIPKMKNENGDKIPVKHFFARVTGSEILAKKVEHQGNSRAYLSEDNREALLSSSFNLNAKNLCESKKYPPEYFSLGVTASLAAQKLFIATMGNADNVRKMVHDFIPKGLELTSKEKIEDLKFQYARIVEKMGGASDLKNIEKIGLKLDEVLKIKNTSQSFEDFSGAGLLEKRIVKYLTDVQNNSTNNNDVKNACKDILENNQKNQIKQLATPSPTPPSAAPPKPARRGPEKPTEAIASTWKSANAKKSEENQSQSQSKSLLFSAAMHKQPASSPSASKFPSTPPPTPPLPPRRPR